MSQDNYRLPDDIADQQRLDALISHSLTLEVESDCVERLEQFWKQQQRAEQQQQQHRLRGLVVAVAASILLLVTWSLLQHDSSSPAVVEHVRDVAPPTGQINETDVAPPAIPLTNRATQLETSKLSSGRTPTTYEQIMFVAQTMPPTETKLSVDRVVSRAIDRVIANPDADSAAVVREASKRRNPGIEWRVFRDELLAECDGASVDRQIAICRLLATNDPKQAVTLLLAMGHQPNAAEISLAAIEQIVGPDQWLQIACRATESETRQNIARRLLASDTKPRLLAFMRMVEDKTLREDALTVARGEAALPVAELIELLDHEESAVRIATAITLGELNRCEMTDSLISRIHTRPSHSTEAWFALFACECEAADQFLTQATYDPKLLGQFNNARLQWTHASH